MKKYIYSFFAIACSTLMLSACGNNASDVSDAQIDDVVESDAEEMDDEEVGDEKESEEDSNEVDYEQEVEPAEENNLPEPTFVQTGENNYTVTVDCPDNSNSPEVQTAQGYDEAIGYASIGGVSENLITAVLAAGVKNGGNLGQINFDAYNDYVFDVYDFHYGWDATAVFTKTPENYGNDVYIVTQEQFNTFDGQYQYVMSFVMQNALKKTNYNLTCALDYYQDPVKWEQIMQEFEAQTGLSADEIYANYDARTIYETLGKEYPGFAEEVISMISPDEVVKVAKPVDGSFSVITYNFERTKVKSM